MTVGAVPEELSAQDAPVVGSIGIEPRPSSADTDLAWRAFINGSLRLMASINQDLADSVNLYYSEFRILQLLSETGGPVRMSALADAVVASRSRVTRQITKLEAHGLVERISADDDLRGVLARVTDKGRELLDQAAIGHGEKVKRLFLDYVSDEELSIISDVFSRLDSRLAGVVK